MLFESLLSVYSLGAAIIADIKKISAVYSQLSNNPLCFLLYEDPTLSPNNWKNVKHSFGMHVLNVLFSLNRFLLLLVRTVL